MNIFLPKRYIPKKCFGQNFLYDKNVIHKIISFINPKKQDALIEVGPGLAALTYPMCNFVDNLLVIELDKDLSDFLRNCSFYNKIEIFVQDVNTFNFQHCSIKKKKLLRIFGNLPYNISVQLILYLIKFTDYIVDINVMVQEEVAKRLLSSCGKKNYGRLTILSQCYYDIFFGFNISPISFFPIPKVESSFIKIIPKKFPLYPLNKIEDLRRVTRLAFQKRRKMLRNSLSSIFNIKMLLQLGIDPTARAENISVLEYCKLAYYLNKSSYCGV